MVSAAAALLETVNPRLDRDDIINTLKENSDNISHCTIFIFDI